MEFKQGDNFQENANDQTKDESQENKTTGKSPFGKSSFGKSSFGKSPFGKSSFGSSFKNPNTGESKPKNEFHIPTKTIIFVIMLIIAFMSFNSFIYIVAEDEVATVKEFGNITKVIVDTNNQLATEQNALDNRFKDVQIVNSKGLFFKIPFITTVQKDTSKLITYISAPAQINTRDKIKYKISIFAQWEISHPGLYRSSLGSVQESNNKIDEVAYAVVIQKVNSLSSTEFMTDKEKLYGALDDAMAELNDVFANKGIVLRDIEVYRTILPDSNIESTYRKMIAEREAIAQQKRSEGQEIYQNTVADTDRKVAEIMAESIETAEKVKGEADAKALEIYGNAFSRDPDFYTYWRTLKSYENTINEDSVIFMDKNNDYLKIFSNGN